MKKKNSYAESIVDYKITTHYAQCRSYIGFILDNILACDNMSKTY